MSEVSAAYVLADRIHSSFFAPSSNLTDEERKLSGVETDLAGSYKTQRLSTFGEVDDRPAYQHLSKSQRNGIFYLSTVFTEPFVNFQFTVISEESPIETVNILAATLFMQALHKIAEARGQD